MAIKFPFRRRLRNVQNGRVWLVGAGPGDPGLLTVRGQEALRQAEAIVYDYLVNAELLKLARPGCEIIYAGKQAGQHTISQEGINALLIGLARQGKRVVRLKGGDPFVFGRGGEEAEALQEAGVTFEVVPGVSSAIAVPAYAGIPVTHRNFASSLTIITGHEKGDGLQEKRVDWEALARLGGTLVFLMGLGQLESITGQLIAAGKDPATPAAVIQWGTLPEQVVVTGELYTLPGKVRKAGLKPPAVTVIGEVVSLQEQLNWFQFAQEVGPLAAAAAPRV